MKQCRPRYGLLLLVVILLSACAPFSSAQSAAILAAAQPAALNPTPLPILAAPAAGVQPRPIRTALDLVYAHSGEVDAHQQMLDVYYTDPLSARLPVMLYVHGGGWVSGDKSQVDAKPQFFVNAGYVFVSVNYRLSPQSKFPAQVDDLAAAVAWTMKNIANYGGDPGRIFVSGHSAGGHLAVLVSSDEHYLKGQGLDLTAVKGVVSIDTAGYDFSIFASRCKNQKLPEPYSIPFGQDPAAWKTASPISYIQAGKHIPPMVIVYSGDVGIGSEVTRELMAIEFAAQLSAAGIPNTLIGALEKNHGEISVHFGQPGDPIGQKTLEFLSRLQ